MLIQYNMVKSKPFKLNLLDERKDISSPEFFCFLKSKLSLNRSKTADPLRFGLSVLYCIYFVLEVNSAADTSQNYILAWRAFCTEVNWDLLTPVVSHGRNVIFIILYYGFCLINKEPCVSLVPFGMFAMPASLPRRFHFSLHHAGLPTIMILSLQFFIFTTKFRS